MLLVCDQVGGVSPLLTVTVEPHSYTDISEQWGRGKMYSLTDCVLHSYVPSFSKYNCPYNRLSYAGNVVRLGQSKSGQRTYPCRCRNHSAAHWPRPPFDGGITVR